MQTNFFENMAIVVSGAITPPGNAMIRIPKKSIVSIVSKKAGAILLV
jgi:hypothetical protein